MAQGEAGAKPAPEIEVLYIEGCPHWQDAVRLAQAAARDAGVAGARVRATLVGTAEEAVRLGLAGSPTVLVAGRNPFPSAPVGAMACRLFLTPHGPAGLPDRDVLVAAIRAAIATQEGLSGA